MILAALLAWPALALLAAGTPRQADLLSDLLSGLVSGRRLDERRRRRLRVAGLVLLGLSLALAVTGGDGARHLIAWIGLVGFQALLVALGCTGLCHWHTPARKPRAPYPPQPTATASTARPSISQAR